MLYLLLGNLGASIVEVANDAIVAETAKDTTSSSEKKHESSSSSSGGLQSFVWMASSIGGVLGNLLGGIAIVRYSPQAMFFWFGVTLAFQFLVTALVPESSLRLPKSQPDVGIRKQLSELKLTMQNPDIIRSITWFAASYAIIPALTGTMFFYQTQHLGINSSVLGISKVVGQAAMLLWGVIYNRHLKSIPPKKLISAVQVTMAVLMLSDVLFVKGVYRSIGIPDSFYVVAVSGVLEVIYFFKCLPFNILIAQLCPAGCEGSLMALVSSSIALALIVNGYFGVVLASCFGITGDDFSGLPSALLVQAACTVVPLYWSYCIPDEPRTKRKGE